MTNIRQFLFGIFFMAVAISSAQHFDKKVTGTKLELPETTISGWLTVFDFSHDSVRKGWWAYAKKFALPKNQRTHYEVTIPATESSRSVVIFTQSLEQGESTNFKLGLSLDNVSEEEKTKYSTQAQAMLLDFKRWYYLRHYEEKLENLDKVISRKGKNWAEWISFIEKRNEILEIMKSI